MMEKWNSRKFAAYALALGAVLALGYLEAPGAAYTALGLIASFYLGGQSYVDGRA